MDDEDDSIFALLAGSDDDEVTSMPAFRELPREQVWSESALVDAWSAALAEFTNASLSQSTGIPVIPLDREHQLIASALWYAPLCPPSGSKPSTTTTSNKRPAPATVEEQAEEEEEADLNDDEDDEEPYEEVLYDGEVDDDNDVDDQVVEALLQSSSSIIGPLQPALSNKRSFVHPSRLDHVKESQPYINPSEWQPVTTSSIRSNTTTTRTQVTVSAATSSSLVVPDPPTVENAIPQDSALTDSQPPQEALEKALHAWYTAGYAAALYHVRSGLVKP